MVSSGVWFIGLDSRGFEGDVWLAGMADGVRDLSHHSFSNGDHEQLSHVHNSYAHRGQPGKESIECTINIYK